METSNKIGEAGSTNSSKRNHSPSPSQSGYTYLFATHDGASGEFVAIPGGEKYNYHHVVEQPADGKWNYKFDTPPDHQP